MRMILAFSIILAIACPSAIAQTPLPSGIDRFPESPTPSQPLQPLTPPEIPLPPVPEPPTPPPTPDAAPETIKVDRYEVIGSTLFSAEDFENATRTYTGTVSFDRILAARDAIRDLYASQDYLGTIVYIPAEQSVQVEGGVVQIQVVENGLSEEEIEIVGTERLNPGYIRSRLLRATDAPLNRNDLIEALRLLQIDPLIESISADLSAGIEPGTNRLEVKVKENRAFNGQIASDNNRSPSTGTMQRRLLLEHGNLLGLGDGLIAAYTNTDGSHTLDAQYRIPIAPDNTALILSHGRTWSRVLEQPFDRLDIEAGARYYNLTLRHPIFQRASARSIEELAVGVTAERRESETTLLGFPFPLSVGADNEGRTRISVLRFFQEYTQRDNQEVLSARSQFSLGLGAFGATINESAPDSRFFAWQGEARWLRVLAPDTILLLRGNLQLSDRPLLPLEQFALGGSGSVRGYRQDAILADNGAFASVEVQFPLYRSPSRQTVLQLIPFFELGKVWISGGTGTFDRSTLAAIGLGLQLQQGSLFARLDWGIPLLDLSSRRTTWQENGLHFSLSYSLF
ncbi:ShlB/FhaC/HecB family hemolysin secretion/activation protein [Oscillatoria sp. FACHB-1406]|uniref:ShlB/FhaC/HecB family hemolysin secretion/activation protein n=1 Tax=Oscillatoria sp. FACHB-1406 TaxID=2692846 RepID=UPI00168658D3|nr:ShlB/FhaC/HecB family hemolysin secretion/activation protein [Oscillatoria sp. FACHB-1406]MBD2579928.1 ShlB/FhaC/HecB family hemolysin secretion/activation protein [Oscillatoria sp. FACHB-1406]